MSQASGARIITVILLLDSSAMWLSVEALADRG
jgi:hypothetical protein